MEIIVLISLLCLAFFSGSFFEKRHFESILKRERSLLHLAVRVDGKKDPLPKAREGKMVTGSVVISIDYFKSFLASLRGIFGGRIEAYESLLDRARREAVLRMKEEAVSWGASEVVHLRLETSCIASQGGENSRLGAIEVLAYGTAIR